MTDTEFRPRLPAVASAVKIRSLSPILARVAIELTPIRPDGFEGAFESVASYRLDELVEAPVGRIRVAALGAGGLVWLPASTPPASLPPTGAR